MRATSSAFKTRRRTVKVDNFTAPTVPQCPLNSVNAVVLSLMAMGAVVTVHGTVPYSLRTLLFYPLIPYIYIYIPVVTACRVGLLGQISWYDIPAFRRETILSCFNSLTYHFSLKRLY